MEVEEERTVVEPEVGSASLAAAGSSSMHEFIRYFVASFVALLVDAGSLYVLTSYFAVDYLVAGALAFALGITVIYILSVTWVFEARTSKSVGYEFLVFLVIGILGLGLNELVLWVGTGIFLLPILLSKLLSVAVVFSWNFGARKAMLFRHV
jgi:putative flippase GtrA